MPSKPSVENPIWSLFWSFLLLWQHAIASCKEWLHPLLLFYLCPFLCRATNDSTLNSNMHILCGCESLLQYIIVMRNNRLINKWILLWYVDVLVSVSPFRKTSTAAQVTTYMYSGGQMGMAECILQGPGNFKTFQDLSRSSFMTTPPGSDLLWPLPPMMGCYFQDLSSKVSLPPSPPPPPPQHTQTQSQKPHDINSPCFISYN